ncbi:glucosamine-6-phosphate deaminase [Massilibacteroides sp.]|uniref:glucosamine-6-phosphate deaminase n=1 Tax=Massilibacteroides sp. TaxID=2034766 RepID=UPI002618E63C|nr:glucosamine-6-phosphate deaminase [Massilibacteroides sp.]MDD4514979.1 glucosamine-6-phosphate deaminase [Massilibacteroides sp.]
MVITKDKLDVRIYPTTKEMSIAAAAQVAERMKTLLEKKDTINALFAAAPSQSEFFRQLVNYKDIDWNRVNAFHLDEYIGLEQNAPQRFGNFLKRELFGQLKFRNVFYLDGSNVLNEECKRYTALLKEYPIDIACIGIGENGHIAFNDPHVADFQDQEVVKAVELDHMCRQQQVNDKCFDDISKVPTHALTLTIPTILSVPYIYCIVPYKGKAKAVYETLNGDISERCPASILRTKEQTILFLDKDSASLLEEVTYL